MSVNQSMAPVYIKKFKDADLAEGTGDKNKAKALRAEATRLGIKFIGLIGVVLVLVAAGAREFILLLGGEKFTEAWKKVFEGQEPPLENLREILKNMVEENE